MFCYLKIRVDEKVYENIYNIILKLKIVVWNGVPNPLLIYIIF